VKRDLQRCNHCMSEFDESLLSCPVCGRDDALMYPFAADGEPSSPIRYEAQGVWHNRSFSMQHSDWYACKGDEKRYAFHERTVFPTFGEIMAAALQGKEAGDQTRYWLEGHAETGADLMERVKELGLLPGTYRAEECKYGPGVFPVCSEFEEAVKWFEATGGSWE
jgi:hypothetical protein